MKQLIYQSNTTKNNIVLSGIKMTLNQPVIKSESANLRTHTMKRPVSRYEGSIEFHATGAEAVAKMRGFINEHGSHTPFMIAIPGYDRPALPLKANPVITGSYTLGSTQLTFQYMSPKDRLTVGDVFTLPNDTKVYTIADINDTVLTINPPLRRPITSTAPMNTNPLFKILLRDSTLEIKFIQRDFMVFDLDFQEVIE